MVRSKSTPIEPMCDWRRSPHHEGFSIVELLIVISVIGILAAISGPNILGQMPKFRLNGATRQILGEMMAARMKAVSQNNEFKIFFVDNHQYMILDDKNNNGTANTGEATQTKDIQTSYRDVTFTSSANPIFRPRGTATGACITLTNTSGSKYIRIAITGRVKITSTEPCT